MVHEKVRIRRSLEARRYEWYYSPTRRCLGDALLYLPILLILISTAGLELRSQTNHVMAGFERTNVSDSRGGEVQQAADADAAQRHYQAGLAALEKGDLAAAEEEMQAAARLAPKDALIFYKLAVIQSKRGEWEAGIKSVSVAQKLGFRRSWKMRPTSLARR
jgi:tetratricopeptide (TPR) repeat protein